MTNKRKNQNASSSRPFNRWHRDSAPCRPVKLTLFKKVKAFVKVYVLLKVSVSDGSLVKSTTVCVTCAGTGVCASTNCMAVSVIPVISMCAPHTHYSVSGPDMFCLIVITLTDSHSQRNVEMTHGLTAAASVHRFILPPLSFAALSTVRAGLEHVQLINS